MFHMQKKGIVHNHLVISNIVLQRSGHVQSPVIIGFTLLAGLQLQKQLTETLPNDFLICIISHLQLPVGEKKFLAVVMSTHLVKWLAKFYKENCLYANISV